MRQLEAEHGAAASAPARQIHVPSLSPDGIGKREPDRVPEHSAGTIGALDRERVAERRFRGRCDRCGPAGERRADLPDREGTPGIAHEQVEAILAVAESAKRGGRRRERSERGALSLAFTEKVAETFEGAHRDSRSSI
jgi:hypothetical protein